MDKTAMLEAVRNELLKKGNSVSSWSRKHGFDINFVTQILHRYAGNPRPPYSPRVYAILSTLHKDTGINLMRKVS